MTASSSRFSTARAKRLVLGSVQHSILKIDSSDILALKLNIRDWDEGLLDYVYLYLSTQKTLEIDCERTMFFG